MSTYTFTFKKGDIFLEYVTTNKESMERQFQIWVTCASVWAYNQEKIEKGLMPKPNVNKKNKSEEKKISKPIVEIKKEEPKHKKQEEDLTNIEIIVTPEENDFERESQRIIQEYKAEMEAEERKKQTEAKKEEFKQDLEEIIEKENVVSKELSQLYNKSETINKIQEIQPEETTNDFQSSFDTFLQKSMSKTINDIKEKKDDRFLKVLKVKNITEKIDYLIVTAYYLSEFERLDRFTLKLVNAKLAENINEILDSSVLQESIDNGYVECLPNYTNIPSATEYRLTEAGEEAFLNGRKK